MPVGRDPVTVEKAMTRHPISIAPDAPVETAMAVMRERRFRHLPVVDNAGRLVGVISDRDVRGMILAPAVDQFSQQRPDTLWPAPLPRSETSPSVAS
jgi:acetoin utilization protein AcuB